MKDSPYRALVDFMLVAGARMKILMLSTLFALSGCASSLQGDIYSRDETRKIQSIEYGQIRQIRPVIIDGTRTGAGAAAGGAAGAVLGGGISSGSRESRLGSIVFGALGVMIGDMTEDKLTKAQGLEMLLLLDSGQAVVVVQEVDDLNEFTVGQRIRLISSDLNQRVTPETAPLPTSI